MKREQVSSGSANPVKTFWRETRSMESFSIPAEDFDLELTMTCGQTFCWHRIEGELYGTGPSRFYTFRDGKPLIVEQRDNSVFVQTELSPWEVKEALGLHRDLERIFSTFPDDVKLEKARKGFWGLRVLKDEFFPCLISYLCSPQMRIPRIKQMHDGIARKYGGIHEVNDKELLRFPDREELSAATEEELRELGLGYRAEYVFETVEMVEELDPSRLEEMDYREAKERLLELHGVGEKVADCVLLFSLGFKEAYPIDTWAEKAVAKHYPEKHSEDYTELSENMRSHFGEYAGWAQEYIFHAAREGVVEVE